LNSYAIKAYNLTRIVNLIKVFASFQLSRLVSKPIHWGMPVSLSVEPTTACNLGCSQCPSGIKAFSRSTGNLKPEMFTALMNQTSPWLTYITFYFQGEPFINKDVFKMIRQASNAHIFTASSTNGHFLNLKVCHQIITSGLNQLIVSIDGITQDSYEKYRTGGDLATVLQGLKNLVQAKKESNAKHLTIIWQMIAFKSNEQEIEQAQLLANEMGVDEFRIKTAQVYEQADMFDLIPEQEKYSRYVLKNGVWKLKNKFYNHCWRMWQGCVMTWDGKIVPCCFDKDAQHTVGQINTSSFKSIWSGNSMNRFRQSILSNRKEIDICSNCSEGSKVWA